MLELKRLIRQLTALCEVEECCCDRQCIVWESTEVGEPERRGETVTK
jgi:hypothetical protein